MNAAPDSLPTSMTMPDFAANAQEMSATMSEAWNSMSGLTLPMSALAEMQKAYLTQSTELWNQTLQNSGDAAKVPADRRFAGSDWVKNPASAYVAQMYLLNSRTLLQMADQLEGDTKTRQRIRFAVQQWIDASAPSNYLALNPEAQRKALETKGDFKGAGAIKANQLIELRKGVK